MNGSIKGFFSLLETLKNQTAEKGAENMLGDLPEWNLNDLYDGLNDPKVEEDLARSEKYAGDISQSYKGKLGDLAANDPAVLAGAIRKVEEFSDLMGRLGSFAGLVYASNTTDPANAKFYGDIQEKLTAISTQTLFFSLELNLVDDAVLEEALKNDALAYYKPWIMDLRAEKPFQLEEKLEELFVEKAVTGSSAFNRLFDETMAGLKFDIDGQELTLEAVLNRFLDEDEAVRKQASEALAAVFKDNLRLFTLVTNTLAKDKEISDRWRGFEDVADSRHLANRVEGPVVDALVSAVQDAYPRLSHRYYAMKAKWMGKDILEHWDRNAPLPTEDTRVVPWDEARETVLSAYGHFSQEMRGIADDFFVKGWIDAPVKPGKSPGAFAHPTVPSAHPYVLVNYQGKTRDVMTLAHELGHGVHQVLAGEQGALMAPTPLTLAETASVFGEMLTFQSMLEKAETKEQRKVLLAGKVEDMLNTVVRQIAFYTFERKVHEARRQGELTSDQLCEFWLDVQRESLGPSVRLGDGYETFWTYIPHFIHSPFYVYAYAFGDCLVNSLYAVYENAEDGFQEKYFDMLKAGGSKHHSELLAPFGLDATDPDFWKMGLSLLERMIDELETLDA